MLNRLAPVKLSAVQQMAKPDLVSAVTNQMSNRDLLVLLNGGSETNPDDPIREYNGPAGEMTYEQTVERDVETNEVVHAREITWTFYDTGEVMDISVTDVDADGNETTKIIHHYTDGRQPDVEIPGTVLPEPPVIEPGPVKRLI